MFNKEDFQILPWQKQYLQWWQQKIGEQTLPQALLINAPAGSGKKILAANFAQMAFCLNAKADFACNTCENCKLLLSGNFPDLFFIAPKNKNILIEQVRDLMDLVLQSDVRNAGKIIVVEQAHSMNTNAANAILKILEEPPDKTRFLFLTEKPKLLPATILSRMQKLNLKNPDFEQALAWLNKQGLENAEQKLLENRGLPLLALTAEVSGLEVQKAGVKNLMLALLNKNITAVEAAAQIDKDLDLANLVEILQIQTQMALKFLVLNEQNAINASFYATWLNKTNSYKLLEFYQNLLEATQKLATNPNRALFLEFIFISFVASLTH